MKQELLISVRIGGSELIGEPVVVAYEFAEKLPPGRQNRRFVGTRALD
jgi:hypothetical protein